MAIKLPFSLMPLRVIRNFSRPYLGIASKISRLFPGLGKTLDNARFDLGAREYVAISLVSVSISFVFFFLIASVVLLAAKIFSFFLVTLISLLMAVFIFFQHIYYPKLYVSRRIREVERNLIPALQDMLAQINSGVPLFNVMVNIANSDYGEVSKEFVRAVREINTGRPQIEVLDEVGAKNPSIFFRRAVWQISNGLTSGANIGEVVKESIHALSEEQVIQIQTYGSRLSPVAMFYMMVSVIFPALSITFLIVLASLVSISSTGTKLIFWGIYALIVFFNIMFLGIIKSRRPNLI
ncbi:MAG: type II secretion system F family protein [Nanoarchaeota archaeon]